MHSIESTYVSLLADVARLSGFSEIRGSYEGLQWCLNEAPKLEKYILDCIELGRKPELDAFPDGLRRLAAASVVDAEQLRYLRQLLLFSYKAEVTHDIKTTEKAFENFLEVNTATGKFGAGLSRSSPRLLDSARRQVQSVIYRFRESVFKPSHGPGAVTTSKETWRHRYQTIESIYPYSDIFFLSQNREHIADLDDMDWPDNIEAKVIAVPKDTRGPRLICVHPAEAIWVQQALRRELERAICLPRSAKGPWPHGHIFFDDQSVNGQIALLSSKSRRYATIDMKDASDRISESLVQILFGRKYRYFGCCRAQKFRIPKFRTLKDLRGDIYSYAPMGNATTFPVQSLVFWAICVASLQRQGFHQPGAVFVFGDDIIVPSECAEVVVDDLESFGLLANRTKSFWRGAFRESCGVDAFNGIDVTPVRWKTTLDAEHATGIESLSDIAMRLRIAGYEEAARSAYAIIGTRLAVLSHGKARLSLTNNPHHGGIAEYVTRESQVWRDAFWHRDYQWFCSPVWRLLEKQHKRVPLSGWNHVLESVCSLERTGRSRVPDRSVSRRTRLTRGWIAIK